jgi:exo-1,4-beta-D-glucosaminidase
VYDDTTLFFSSNLETVDGSQFTVPWLYREEINLKPGPDRRFFIETNGISSKADLYFNGVTLATKDSLKGAYGGQKIDVTSHVTPSKNAVLIRAYPTNYLADFALGFVDWNPYPADNGTGVWREVTVSLSGPVSLLKPRVSTDYVGKPSSLVTATINVVVSNESPNFVKGTIKGTIKEIDGSARFSISTSYSLKAGESQTITTGT